MSEAAIDTSVTSPAPVEAAKGFEPNIVAFCCHYCAFAAADLAGVMRLQYPHNVKIIRIPCTGKIDVIYLMRAFERGADGVFVAGCLEGNFGYPCFRPYSLPIILVFTDAPFHNGPTGLEPYAGHPSPNWTEAMAALNEIGAAVLGFSSSGYAESRSHDDLEATAVATGAVRDDGTPLVWDLQSSGLGLDDAVVESIADLSSQIARDVTTAVEESPRVDDGIDAADFITRIVPTTAAPADGIRRMDQTTFYGVQAGTTLTFGISFYNDFVPHEDEPQVFTARIVVLGDGTARVDDRRVIVLVPPRDIPIE